MLYVLFEAIVKPECSDEYLKIAAELNKALQEIPGFIRSERFTSLKDERKLLSLSVWEDEASIERWRNVLEHRHAQQHGREYAFLRYTITVTSAIRCYTDTLREEAPEDSKAFFEK